MNRLEKKSPQLKKRFNPLPRKVWMESPKAAICMSCVSIVGKMGILVLLVIGRKIALSVIVLSMWWISALNGKS